jgi:hypothetical protein
VEIIMQSIREIVDAGTLSQIFNLPASFANKQIEIVMRPVEDKVEEDFGMPLERPRLSRVEIDEIVKNDPVIRSLTGCIKAGWLPPPLTRENVTMEDIRELRLKERYEG